MEETRTCIVCGCALGEREETCPLCGTPASGQGAAIAHAGEPAERGVLARLKKGKSVRVLAACAVLAVVAAGALVARAWVLDQELHGQAAQVGGAHSVSAPVQVPAGREGEGLTGNVAAGGIIARDGQALYEASADGVYFREAADSSEGAAWRVSADRAYDLAVYDGRVCYLAATASDRDRFEGSSIRSIPSAAGSSTGLSSSATVYQPASPEARLQSLTSAGGACYFLERAGGSYEVKRLDASQRGQAETLLAFTATDAWLFAVDADAVYLATSTDSGFSVKRGQCTSDGASFSEVARGVAPLAAVAYEGGALYYAPVSAGDAHLQRNDLRGNVVEYDDVVNPVRIAASGDVVAVMTESGRLAWVDAVTGVSHDLTDRLDSLIPNVVPAKVALGVCGEWVFAEDGRGGFCRMSVNDAKTVSAV